MNGRNRTGTIGGLMALLVLASYLPARGQAVQLPTFRQFGVSTTVVVPDRGTAVLAGNRSLREAAVGNDLQRWRTARDSRSAISVHVHDFAAADRRLATVRRPHDAAADRAAAVAGGIRIVEEGDAATRSVAELARQRADQQRQQHEAEQRRADDLIQQGDRLASQGKSNVARIYYQMARRGSDEPTRRLVEQKLRHLSR